MFLRDLERVARGIVAGTMLVVVTGATLWSSGVVVVDVTTSVTSATLVVVSAGVIVAR